MLLCSIKCTFGEVGGSNERALPAERNACSQGLHCGLVDPTSQLVTLDLHKELDFSKRRDAQHPNDVNATVARSLGYFDFLEAYRLEQSANKVLKVIRIEQQ